MRDNNRFAANIFAIMVVLVVVVALQAMALDLLSDIVEMLQR